MSLDHLANYNDFLSEILITEEQIQKRTQELGEQISQDYQGKETYVFRSVESGEFWRNQWRN